ncbi:Aldehyde/histidinol dehydrogenase, partial [Lipomyces orientalis]
MIIWQCQLARQLILQPRRYYSSVETTVTLPSGRKYRQPIGLFIANKFGVSRDGKKLTTYDPRSGRPIASVFAAGSADVNNAVQSARLAFDPWRTTPGTERGILLHNLSRLIEDHKDILGSIEAFDTGKSPVSPGPAVQRSL